MNKPNDAEFEGKTVLIVNTGSPKKRFVLQKLKKLGLELTAVNSEKNWAAPYISDWIITDTSNHKETLKAVSIYLKDRSIDGVITFWEDDVILTAKIADKFNFIGIPPQVALLARNKFLFRQFCKDNHLPFTPFSIIKKKDDLKKASLDLHYPLVIKPAFGASSAFVVRVDDFEELKSAYDYIRSNFSPNIESALSEGDDIMLEEYIDGDEVDIDLIIQNGKVKFSSLADNYRTKEPFFIETTHVLPSNLPDIDQTRLMEMAEETLEKMGVRDACVHFEAKITKNGPVPLEANLRMGGDEVYVSVRKVWGVDLIELTLSVALGNYIRKKIPTSPKSYMMTETLQAPYSGIISSIQKDKNFEKLPYLEQFYFAKDTGDTVFVPPEGYDYIGWLTVSGENFNSVQENLDEALGKLRYEIVRFDWGSAVGKTERKSRFSSANLNKSLVLGAAKFETIRKISKTDQRKLVIAVACNTYSGDSGAVEADLASVGRNIQNSLEERGYKTKYIDFNNINSAVEILQKRDFDIIFNVCERINNSSLLEPHAASLFDIFQLPYTGSNPFTLSLCIDKIRVKKLLAFHNIPTPRWDYAYTLDDPIEENLRFPLIVKPANTDNSIGITNESVVTDKKQLKNQLEKIIVRFNRPVLIEEYIEGDEYDVSILGSEPDDLRVLPLSRSIFNNMPSGYWHIYPFEAKFMDDPVYNKIIVQRPPKNISTKLQSLISEIALDTYNVLDCHDYGRVEIRVDENDNPYVLELNPNPSINIGDCVPNVAELDGMNYGDFLEDIVSMAILRYRNKPPYYHLQTNIF